MVFDHLCGFYFLRYKRKKTANSVEIKKNSSFCHISRLFLTHSICILQITPQNTFCYSSWVWRYPKCATFTQRGHIQRPNMQGAPSGVLEHPGQFWHFSPTCKNHHLFAKKLHRNPKHYICFFFKDPREYNGGCCNFLSCTVFSQQFFERLFLKKKCFVLKRKQNSKVSPMFLHNMKDEVTLSK